MKNENNFYLLITIFVLCFVVIACNFVGGQSSPTNTFKAFTESIKQKDVEGYKKTLSKASLDMFEKGAKEQKKSFDDALKSNLDEMSKTFPTSVETRNEKIEGNNATLEVKDDKTGNWDKMPFVKENGEWKIAFDKLIEQLLEKLEKKEK